MSSLPNDMFNFNKPFPKLPDDSMSYNSSAVPVNGTTFAPDANNQIFIDIPKQDFLIPDSLYIKYTITVTTTGTVAPVISSTPLYAPFYRVETICNGSYIESIPGFNLIQNMVVNTTLNPAQKYGLEASYGYTAGAGMDQMNCRVLSATTGETFSVAGPLNCAISNSEMPVPLFAMPQLRFVFTLDTVANLLANVANSAATASYTITNFELCYELFNPTAQFKHDFMLQNPTLNLKTIGFGYTAQTLPTASSGTISLNYNVSYGSVKSAWLYFSGPKSVTVSNGAYDSYDITAKGGDYAVIIAGTQFPQKSLSCLTNRAGILCEMRKASTTFGVNYDTIFDKTNSYSISGVEYNYLIATATTPQIPSKFWLGIHTERLHNNNLFWSGVSTQGSAIVARINCPTATTVSYNVGLIIVYDMIISIDVENQQVSIKK